MSIFIRSWFINKDNCGVLDLVMQSWAHGKHDTFYNCCFITVALGTNCHIEGDYFPKR